MSTVNTPKKDDLKSQAGNVMDKAKEAGQKAADTAGDLAHAAGQKASDMASAATHKAGDLAKTAGQKADSIVAAAGEKARDAADAVRQHGPREGMLGSATRYAADTIEEGGRYLEKEGLSGMMGDVTDLVKRNPVPALLVGIGIGFLLGRALDRS
jgi:ElaB/YqjD/DUF883 family membrane-anchored ribosome-binding protein